MLIIKEVCKRLGVTSTELAERLNVSKASVSQYLNGNPTAERLEAIATALGVPVGALFNDGYMDVHGLIRSGDTFYEVRSLQELVSLTEELAGVMTVPYNPDAYDEEEDAPASGG